VEPEQENRLAVASKRIAEITNNMIAARHAKNRIVSESPKVEVTASAFANIINKHRNNTPESVKPVQVNTDAPIIDAQQVTINTVAPASTTGLKMQSLIINLDDEGRVIDNEHNVVDEQPTVLVGNSALIAKYPILDMLQQAIHNNNLSVVFTETPNMNGYIMGEVFENGVPNIQLSFTVDLEGNFMSPDKKIFIPNVKGNTPIAIELLNLKRFTTIMSKKHINDDMSIFDLYTKEDKEINKLISLASLPEVVDSENRTRVITIVLKDGFQTALTNAKKSDPEVYFAFSEYKSPDSFKLVSVNPDKPMNIVYNGKTAVLNTAF